MYFVNNEHNSLFTYVIKVGGIVKFKCLKLLSIKYTIKEAYNSDKAGLEATIRLECATADACDHWMTDITR